MSTQTQRCFCLKSSGRSVYGMRSNQRIFMARHPHASHVLGHSNGPWTPAWHRDARGEKGPVSRGSWALLRQDAAELQAMQARGRSRKWPPPVAARAGTSALRPGAQARPPATIGRERSSLSLRSAGQGCRARPKPFRFRTGRSLERDSTDVSRSHRRLSSQARCRGPGPGPENAGSPAPPLGRPGRRALGGRGTAAPSARM